MATNIICKSDCFPFCISFGNKGIQLLHLWDVFTWLSLNLAHINYHNKVKFFCKNIIIGNRRSPGSTPMWNRWDLSYASHLSMVSLMVGGVTHRNLTSWSSTRVGILKSGIVPWVGNVLKRGKFDIKLGTQGVGNLTLASSKISNFSGSSFLPPPPPT